MKFKLPKKYFHGEGSAPAALRKVELPQIAKHVLESEGFTLGDPISFPGAYALNVAKDNKWKRVGLKTAVNRWMNTATSLVEAVDKILICTFAWEDDNDLPTGIEFHLVKADDVLGMINKIHDEAIRLGKDPMGHIYMPIDRDQIVEGHIGCVAGAIEDIVTSTYGPYPIKWGARTWGVEDEPDNEGRKSSELSSEDFLTAKKAEIAEFMGFEPDAVTIQFTF